MNLTDWSLAPDPGDIGVRDAWPTARRPEALPAPVPGIIQQVFPDAVGVAWYWTTLRVPAPVRAGHRVLLRFGAVDYRATVWVGGALAGTHDNGESPFELDITDLVQAREDTLVAVRVVAPGDEPVDGLLLERIPHRNKRQRGYHPGWLHAHGGILLPVEVAVEPAIRILDIHAIPDPATGQLPVELRVRSDAPEARSMALTVSVGPDHAGGILDVSRVSLDVAPGEHAHRVELRVDVPRRWDLDDPFLYRVTATLEPAGSDIVRERHERSVRIGFRELRVSDGFFELNGRRILMRSSHTGNHVPVGQIVPPTRDMLRTDLIYAKAAGFNTLRFMSGVAWPEQLDLADELGLMIYEEPMGAWLLQDSPEMIERYDASLREMILRDRNHPSVTVWGLLTETLDGARFRHAVDGLGTVRALDPTRLVVLNSGRFDAQPAIGSVSNPGGSAWEHVWGNEAPDAPGRALVPDPATGWLTPESWIGGDLSLAGSIEGNGDTHTYPIVPHAPSAIAFLRGLGQETKPHMLSEYGIGSLMDVIGETRDYEQAGAREDLLDAALIRSMAERFETDWHDHGLDDLYPFPHDFLRAAQRQHARYRELGFDIVRSNPRIPAFNVTGLLDHALTGEGFWTFWRRWKPGSLETLAEGWAPLRWSLLSEPRHVHAGRQVRIELVLANEGVLRRGRYPASVRLWGERGTVWETHPDVVIAEDPDGSLPLAVPVLDTTIAAPGEPGRYVLAAQLDRGGWPAAGRLPLHVSAAPEPIRPAIRVAAWGLDADVRSWLETHGVATVALDATAGPCDVVLVGAGADPLHATGAWPAIHQRLQSGATVIVLDPQALQRGDETLGWLPFEHAGRCVEFYDWVYHREWVRTRHLMFGGSGSPGLMDWDVYGPLLGPRMYEGLPRPDELASIAFAVGYSTPGGYASGVVAGAWSVGQGRLFLSAFRILDQLDHHPSADTMLMGLLAWARVADR